MVSHHYAPTKLKTCYTLSRLKGIETSFVGWGPTSVRVALLYTFPFEGNWNETSVLTSRLKESTCYTLSRLKGIETGWLLINFKFRRLGLLYTFPFEGNWNKNGKRTSEYVLRACYTLSRLKGIETLVFYLRVDSTNLYLAIHFPVWRELKPCRLGVAEAEVVPACYTLSRLKGIETIRYQFPTHE